MKKRCKHHWYQFAKHRAMAFVMPRAISARRCFKCSVEQEFADERKTPRWVTVKKISKWG